MSFEFYMFVGITIFLLSVLVWSLKRPTVAAKSEDPLRDLASEVGTRHVAYLAQIRQSLSDSDSEYLAERAPAKLAKRVAGERKTVALRYLKALKSDFDRLLQLAQVITKMSPEIAALQELERLKLTVRFVALYELVRLRVVFGAQPLPGLSELSDTVSALTVRIESAIRELGERAAMAAELASALDGRGVDVR